MSAGVDEDVAGVRVGVEERFGEVTAVHEGQEFAADGQAVVLFEVGAVHLTDVDAGRMALDQDARGGVHNVRDV